jgi:hypothetical protein
MGVFGGDDFGAEEEERKPSLEYLDSLNDYRKRSRSQEDDGVGKKTARVEENGHHAKAEDDPVVYGSWNVLFYFILFLMSR